MKGEMGFFALVRKKRFEKKTRERRMKSCNDKTASTTARGASRFKRCSREKFFATPRIYARDTLSRLLRRVMRMYRMFKNRVVP